MNHLKSSSRKLMAEGELVSLCQLLSAGGVTSPAVIETKAPGLKNRGLSGEVNGLGEEIGQARERAEVGGQARVGEKADAFHVVVELLLRQGLHYRRDVAELAITPFLGEEDLDLELDFQFNRRGVEQDLMRGHDAS